MSWSILDGMRLMFHRDQELDLQKTRADTLRLHCAESRLLLEHNQEV